MPLRKYHSYLSDIIRAIEKIQSYCEEKTFEDYLEDEFFRDAVERKLIIVGEALVQAKQHYPQIEQDISNLRQIIAFRNGLVHAYLYIDDKTVWGIVKGNLEPLLQEASQAIEK